MRSTNPGGGLVILLVLVAFPAAVVGQGVPILPVNTPQPPYGWVEERTRVDHFYLSAGDTDRIPPNATCPGTDGSRYNLIASINPARRAEFRFRDNGLENGCQLSFSTVAESAQKLNGTFEANVTVSCHGGALYQGLSWTVESGSYHKVAGKESESPTSCHDGIQRAYRLHSTRLDFEIGLGVPIYFTMEPIVTTLWASSPAITVSMTNGNDSVYLGGLSVELVTKRERRSDEVPLEPLETPALGLLSLVALVVPVALARSKRS